MASSSSSLLLQQLPLSCFKTKTETELLVDISNGGGNINISSNGTPSLLAPSLRLSKKIAKTLHLPSFSPKVSCEKGVIMGKNRCPPSRFSAAGGRGGGEILNGGARKRKPESEGWMESCFDGKKSKTFPFYQQCAADGLSLLGAAACLSLRVDGCDGISDQYNETDAVYNELRTSNSQANLEFFLGPPQFDHNSSQMKKTAPPTDNEFGRHEALNSMATQMPQTSHLPSSHLKIKQEVNIKDPSPLQNLRQGNENLGIFANTIINPNCFKPENESTLHFDSLMSETISQEVSSSTCSFFDANIRTKACNNNDPISEDKWLRSMDCSSDFYPLMGPSKRPPKMADISSCEALNNSQVRFKLPKYRRRRQPKKNKGESMQRKEVIDKFSRVSEPSGLLGFLKPGIIPRMRDSKQIHSILESVVRSADKKMGISEEVESKKRNCKLEELAGKESEGCIIEEERDKLTNRNHPPIRDRKDVKDLDLKRCVNHSVEVDAFCGLNSCRNQLDEGVGECRDYDELFRKGPIGGMHGEHLPASDWEAHEEEEEEEEEEGPVHTSVGMAFHWMELLCLDIKGRLSALKRSRRRVRNLLVAGPLAPENVPSVKGQIANGAEVHLPHGNSSQDEFKHQEMERWRTLFLHMDHALSLEGAKLENWMSQIKEMQTQHHHGHRITSAFAEGNQKSPSRWVEPAIMEKDLALSSISYMANFAATIGSNITTASVHT